MPAAEPARTVDGSPPAPEPRSRGLPERQFMKHVTAALIASIMIIANCDAARAAGAAPLHRGDPGYRSALDGDDDGVACE